MSQEVKSLVDKYMKKRGISKEKAIDELRDAGFNFEPEQSSESESPATVEETGPLERTITGTARNLGAVAAIQGLQKSINSSSSGIPTMGEMFSYKMMRDMMDEDKGERKNGSMTREEFQQALADQRQEFEAKMAQSDKDRLEEENRRLREEKAETDRRQERAAELQPLYDAMQATNKSVSDLAAQVAKVGTPAEKSEALQVAETLGTSIRDLAAKLGPPTPANQDAMTQLNQTLDVVSKIEERLGVKKAGTEGVGDWKSLAIAEIGETGRLFINELKSSRNTETSGTPNPNQNVNDEQLAKIRVQAVVAEALKKGAAQIDVYAIARQLSLTPEQVMKAIEQLQAEGLITMGQQQPATEKKEERGPLPGVTET